MPSAARFRLLRVYEQLFYEFLPALRALAVAETESRTKDQREHGNRESQAKADKLMAHMPRCPHQC